MYACTTASYILKLLNPGWEYKECNAAQGTICNPAEVTRASDIRGCSEDGEVCDACSDAIV